jgi:hypothetical protein
MEIKLKVEDKLESAVLEPEKETREETEKFFL